MKTKKLIALVLSLVMVVGLLPTMALADDDLITITKTGVTSSGKIQTKKLENCNLTTTDDAKIKNAKATTIYLVTAEETTESVIKNGAGSGINLNKIAHSFLDNGNSLPTWVNNTKKAFSVLKTVQKNTLGTQGFDINELDSTAKAFYYIYFDFTDKSGSIFGLLIQVLPKQEEVSKSDLLKAIEEAPNVKTDMVYYHENDRYSGTTTSDDGFWADMRAVVDAAYEVYCDTDATQAQVDAAAATLDKTNPNSELSKAIAKLIPATQINPTGLYEMILRNNNFYPPANEAQYTTASWTAYRAVMDPAESYLRDHYNDPVGNQSIADAYTTAVDALVTNHVLDKKLSTLDNTLGKARMSDAQMACAGLKCLRNNLFKPGSFTASNYTNWSDFATACEAANAFLASHDATKLTLESGVNEAKSYSEAYQAFWKACYSLTDQKNTITVTLDMTDTFARVMKTDSLAGGVYVLSLDKDHATLEGAAAAAGLDLEQLAKTLNPDESGTPWASVALGVYINGVYTQYTIVQESFPGAVTKRIKLKDGDRVLLARMDVPMAQSSSGSGADLAGLREVGNSIRYAQFVKDGAALTSWEAAAGAEFGSEIKVVSQNALPTHFNGRVSPLAGAEIYRSEAFATEAQAKAASASIATGVTTAADGSFSLTLYSANNQMKGWYLLNVLSSDSNPGLTNATHLLVHVTDPADLSGIRAKLKEELDAVYNAYDSDFYSTEQKQAVDAYHLAGDTGIANGATSGDIYAAFQTAYEGITAIQRTNESSLELFLANVRAFLKYLPTLEDAKAGKLYSIDKMVLDQLFGADGWYTRMTAYQRSQFTSKEGELLSFLKGKYESTNQGVDLPQIPAFTLTIEVRDADTNEIVNIPIFDYLRLYYIDAVSYSERHQFIAETQRNGTATYDEATATYTLPTDGYYWMSVSSGALASAMGDYTNAGFVFSFDDHYVYSPDGVTNLMNTYALRENATKTIYVRKENTDLQNAKTTALQTLETAYKGYNRSNYTDADWTILRTAYENGVAAINAAETKEAVRTALNTALADMSALQPKQKNTNAVPGWGEGTDFDAGTIVGYVTVTAENNTFSDGAFTGTIFSKSNYAIGENDNMMTVILRALYDNGYGWEGTGGSGFGISYLAQIFNDDNRNGVCDGNEQKMGEFSGDPGSGWMGALNDFMVNEGLDMFTVAGGQLGDGDTIALMYTQNLGVDLGGSWGNSDTTLKSLEVEGGTLTPDFVSGTAGGSYDYALVISGSSAGIVVTPHATNINYMVKTFLNEKVTDDALHNSYYRRTETITVHPGDVIYVGCGERAWPSMNKQGDEARGYTATWYALHVVSESNGADYVNEQLGKLPKVTYSNYKTVQAKIAEIDAVIAKLSSSEKAKVDSTALNAAKDKVSFYQQIDAVKAKLAALPKEAGMSDEQIKAAKAQIEAAYAAYTALTEEQQGYITVGDAKNYNALVDRLSKLAPETSAQTIVGSDKKPEKDGNEVTPAQVVVAPEVAADGTAKAEVKAEDVSKALEEAPDAKTLTVTVETEGADKVEADLPAEAVKAAADAGVGLNVETENGTVKVDAGTLAEAAKAGKAVAVTVTENKDGTTTVGVTADGKAVEADVKIKLEAKDGQMLVVVGADGSETPVILSASEDGTMYAKVPAGSTVKVVDAEGKEFGDVKAGDWFAQAVEFVSSHGIFQGTGDGTFAPGTTMNRAMLAMVLYRIDGAAGGGSSTFADVKPEDWFADAVSWAADAGIVNGRGEGFAPDAPVTREEIATMLYRFVQYLGVDVRESADLGAFPDGGKTSDWAKDAMAWAVSVGLFQGDETGALNPGGQATRAQVATLVERLVTLLVK